MPIGAGLQATFAPMAQQVTEKELAFVKYWAANRNRQRKLLYQLAFGLPLGLFLAGIILFNFQSGWYIRAEMVANGKFNPVVLYVALLIIAVFVGVFSKKFQWDQQEQRYREILAKLEQQAANPPAEGSSASINDAQLKESINQKQ